MPLVLVTTIKGAVLETKTIIIMVRARIIMVVVAIGTIRVVFATIKVGISMPTTTPLGRMILIPGVWPLELHLIIQMFHRLVLLGLLLWMFTFCLQALTSRKGY